MLRGDARMLAVERLDQPVVPLPLWGHPRPRSVTGEEAATLPNTRSIVKVFVREALRRASADDLQAHGPA